jgi:2-desacetyl-2-hydroxyethyl bacteriochlorophyllide A dehydrogenase
MTERAKLLPVQSHALLFTGVNAVALGAVEIPEPEQGEVLIETAFSAISPGTERRCLAGLQAGAPAFPFVPGYALSGHVLRTARDVTLHIGTRVFCTGTRRVHGVDRLWGGHVAHAVVPVTDLRLVPENVSLEHAALTKLAAIAHHGTQLSKPQPLEVALIVGLGPIGILSARLHAIMGCRVIGVDPLPSRCARLAGSGMAAFTSLEAAKSFLPDGADIVVDATGVPAVLAEALQLARTLPWGDHDLAGARVLIQGSSSADILLPYDAIFQREAVIFTPRDANARDERAVLELMASGQLAVDDLVTAVSPPGDAARAYKELGADLLTALFSWADGSRQQSRFAFTNEG